MVPLQWHLRRREVLSVRPVTHSNPNSPAFTTLHRRCCYKTNASRAASWRLLGRRPSGRRANRGWGGLIAGERWERKRAMAGPQAGKSKAVRIKQGRGQRYETGWRAHVAKRGVGEGTTVLERRGKSGECTLRAALGCRARTSVHWASMNGTCVCVLAGARGQPAGSHACLPGGWRRGWRLRCAPRRAQFFFSAVFGGGWRSLSRSQRRRGGAMRHQASAPAQHATARCVWTTACCCSWCSRGLRCKKWGVGRPGQERSRRLCS